MRNAPVQEIHSTVCSRLAGEHWAALWLANMSAVWKYSTLETPQSKTAKCNVCKAVIQRGRSSPTSYNTTNTIKCLKKHHMKEHKDFFWQKDERSRQESLLESFQKLFPADNVKANINFIVLDDQPLTMVENAGFLSLIIIYRPIVHHPGDTYQRLHYLNYTTECRPS